MPFAYCILIDLAVPLWSAQYQRTFFGNDLVYSFFLNLKLRVLAISTYLACISQYASNCGYTFLSIYAFSSFKEKLLRGRQIMRLEEKFLSQVKRGLEIFARKNV